MYAYPLSSRLSVLRTDIVTMLHISQNKETPTISLCLRASVGDPPYVRLTWLRQD